MDIHFDMWMPINDYNYITSTVFLHVINILSQTFPVNAAL